MIVIGLLAAVCLAVPRSAGAIVYFPGAGSSVARAELDGTHVETPWLTLPHSDIPGDFRDRVSRMVATGKDLFFAQANERILRSDLDGTHMKVLSDAAGGLGASGLAVRGEYLYWTGTEGVGRMRVDGTDVQPHFIPESDVTACGVAVDDSYIYWGTSQGKSVARARLDGTQADLSFIQLTNYVCAPAVDAGHVYWSSYLDGTIGRSDLDGTHADPTFITGASFPMSLTLDAAHLYWANSGGGGIGRANLDGTGVTQTFVDVTQPSSVAVDGLAATDLSLAEPAAIIYGQPTTIHGQLSSRSAGPAMGGQVCFTVSGDDAPRCGPVAAGGELSFTPPYLLDVGDTVSASYRGDALHAPSVSPVMESKIAPAGTSAEMLVSPARPVEGDEIVLLVGVVNTSTEVVPFGHVTMWVGDTFVPWPLPLDDDGYAGVIVTGVPAGTYHLVADYRDDLGGPSDFVPSRAEGTLAVAAKPAPPSTGQGTSGTGTPSLPPSVTPLIPVVAKDLRPLAQNVGRALRTRGLAGATKAPMPFRATTPGVLTVQVTARSAGRSAGSARAVVLAAARHAYAAPGTAGLRLKLTAAGRRAARRHRLRTVTVRVRFVPKAGNAAGVTVSSRLKR